jgi:hypothetical protein
MKVTEIKYMKRVNLGNYEHEELSVTGSPSEGESFEVTYAQIKGAVLSALSGEETPKVVKVEAPKVEEKKVEAPKEVEAPKVEEKKVEAPKPAKKVKAVVADEVKKEPTVTLFDSANQLHKKRLAAIFHEFYPGWKDERLIECQAATKKLHDFPFVDLGSDPNDPQVIVHPGFLQQIENLLGPIDTDAEL